MGDSPLRSYFMGALNEREANSSQNNVKHVIFMFAIP